MSAACYTYPYAKADVTTDAVVFGVNLKACKLVVLLIKRGNEPFRNCWALPGGFLDMGEDLDACAQRELAEETGLTLLMEQLHTSGLVGRDPRGRVLSVAYWGVVQPSQAATVEGMDDAKEAEWFEVDNLPPLAFDHASILDRGLKRLREKLRRCPIGVWMLPTEFTITELRSVYEIVQGRTLDPGNFRKKVFSTLIPAGVVGSTGNKRQQVAGRPAALYSADMTAYANFWAKDEEFEA